MVRGGAGNSDYNGGIEGGIGNDMDGTDNDKDKNDPQAEDQDNSCL